jgi:hypothetical protein
MWSLFKQTTDLAVSAYERCGRLCDDACRRAALHRQVHQVWRSVA